MVKKICRPSSQSLPESVGEVESRMRSFDIVEIKLPQTLVQRDRKPFP